MDVLNVCLFFFTMWLRGYSWVVARALLRCFRWLLGHCYVADKQEQVRGHSLVLFIGQVGPLQPSRSPPNCRTQCERCSLLLNLTEFIAKSRRVCVNCMEKEEGGEKQIEREREKERENHLLLTTQLDCLCSSENGATKNWSCLPAADTKAKTEAVIPPEQEGQKRCHKMNGESGK